MGMQTRGEDEKVHNGIFSLSALGNENRRCVKALHDFINKVSMRKYRRICLNTISIKYSCIFCR